jgi:hypothetical protein
MYRNKESWSKEEHALIVQEVKNRGLEMFEEPKEWSDEEMADVDLVSPSTEFERDMAFLVKEKEAYENKKGIVLASQIVSIASVFVSFGFFYMYWTNIIHVGVTSTILICLLAVSVGVTSVIVYVTKNYLPALIVGAISLLISLVALVINLQQLM